MATKTHPSVRAKGTKASVLLGTALVSISFMTPAQAQSKSFMDEIVVTAQKREQGLQSVPLAVTAATGEQLEMLNLTDVGDVEFFTPGLLWGEGGSSQWPTIRGVNTPVNENIGDPSVAFFINGVYKSRTGQALATMVDVERIEVLRGPQGTLFGRNATAGAINVVSRKPTDEFEYGVDGTFGNYSTLEAQGYVNIPITEKFQLRLAGSGKSRDGYVNNIGTGPDLNDEDIFYGRLSARILPSENVEVIARISGMDRDRAGGGAFTYKVLGQMFDVSQGQRSVFGEPVFINPRVRDGIADFVNGVNVGDIGVPVNLDPYVVDTNFKNTERTKSIDADLEITVDLDGMELKSITAYSDFSSLPTNDNDFTSLSDILNRSSLLSQDAETFTQEIQLSSNDDGPLQWVVGAFYLNDKTFEIFSIDDENGIQGPFPNRDGDLTTFVFNRQTDVDTESWAVFGQATYNLTEDFSITAGGRYTEDKKDFKLREFGWLGFLGFNPDIDSSETFDKFTWRLGAEYQVDDDSLLYASVATGFRSGGFNRFVDAGTTDANTFDSETIRTYEVGSKNSLLDGRMRLNLAAYYSKLKNQQVATVISVGGTGQSGFDNAGKSEIYGAELELQAQVTENWFAQGTMAYVHSEYKEYFAAGFAGDGLGDPNVIDAGGSPVIDLAGNTTERSPEFRATLLSGYDFPLDNGGMLTPLVAFTYTSSFYNTQFNTPLLKQDSYTKTDLRLVYTSPDARFKIEGYVENLEDEAVISRGTYGGSNAAFVSYAAPLTYGLRIRLRN
ncbi:MAG: TonB-dependent receptor [Alphaproteobacteria bacterium]|nr:MAG: TonB-dependent receptor [Alphaproteobacteria bacterium]